MALARAGIAGGFTATVSQSLLRLTRLAEHQGPIVQQDWACSCEPDAALQRLGEELRFILLGGPSDKIILLVTFVAGVITGCSSLTSSGVAFRGVPEPTTDATVVNLLATRCSDGWSAAERSHYRPPELRQLALNLGPKHLTAALPVQRRRGGLLLALPAEALSDQALEDLQAGVPVVAFGANGLATVAGDPSEGGDAADGDTVVEVLLVDYSASGYPLPFRLGASEPDLVFLSIEGDVCWPRQVDLWEAASQFLADGGAWAGPLLGAPALPQPGAGGLPPPAGGGDIPLDDEFDSVAGGEAVAGGAAALIFVQIDHALVATLQAALAPLEARLVALEATGLQAGGAAPAPSAVPVPPRAAPAAARVRAAAGYDVGQEAARLGLTPEQAQLLVALAGPPPSRLGDPFAPGLLTGSPLGAGVPDVDAVGAGDAVVPPPGLRHSAPVLPTLPTLPESLAAGSVSDPEFRKQLLLQNM